MDTALGLVNRTNERLFEAELYRLKGEHLAHANGAGDGADVEKLFLQSLKIAKKQKAKSWELRTATSLARLWQRQDKVGDARNLLQPVYNWFTEGFETHDLKDAKALLENLA
jgi:predicted ATPase